MEKNRQIKMMFIVALVLSVTAMTLGFAAFSTTLNISSSATVTPNSDDFKIRLTSVNNDGKLAFNGGNASVINLGVISDDGQSISDVEVGFTKPGDYVILKAYIDNVGEYDAYLHDITTVEGIDKVCTPVGDVNMDLLNSACNMIGFQFSIQDDDGNYAYDDYGELVDGFKIEKGGRHIMLIRFIYLPDAPYVDGDFNVRLKTASLIYGSSITE